MDIALSVFEELGFLGVNAEITASALFLIAQRRPIRCKQRDIQEYLRLFFLRIVTANAPHFAFDGPV